MGVVGERQELVNLEILLSTSESSSCKGLIYTRDRIRIESSFKNRRSYSSHYPSIHPYIHRYRPVHIMGHKKNKAVVLFLGTWYLLSS